MVSFPSMDATTADAVKYYQNKQKVAELRANIESAKETFKEVLGEVDGFLLSVSMHASNAILDNMRQVDAKYGEDSMEALQACIQSRALQYYAAMLSEAFLDKHKL